MQYYNKAVSAFGVEVIVKWLEEITKQYPGKRWVSVGCGNCAVESLVKVDWLLADPDPLSYASDGLDKPFLDVQYKDVNELLQANPEIKNDCLLFLNWPPPNKSRFDLEAIEVLCPLAVFATTELYHGNGGAGGKEFYNWRADDVYNIIAEARLGNYDIRGERVELDIRMTWWQQPCLPLINTDLPKKYVSQIQLKEQCCIM